ncbi:MAG: aspartate carbamoyltransferase [Gemmatimonadales bacterium]
MSYACSRSFFVLASILLAAACGGSELQRRQADVAEAGGAVMPFDLDRTTHVFEKLDDGGRQTVVADEADAEQISLVRAHLAEEAERFARGDFHDPSMIHGDDMAGLHALVVGHDRIAITYREVERGAEIRYATDDAALVAALHQWFDAQLRDHGQHAQPHP